MSEASQTSAGRSASTAREDHSYLDDEQGGYILKLDAINGRTSTVELLGQDPADVVDHIARFRAYEDSTLKFVLESVTAQVPRPPPPPPVPAPAPTVTVMQSPAPQSGPKPLRVSVSKYSGTESENLTFWQHENELAIAAARITDEQQKIIFTISNLDGVAKTWALTCETNQPGYFSSLRGMAKEMRSIFEPANVAHRQRAAFLASVQGSREPPEYVQELRQLRATMAANAIAEDVMLTVFMDGMKPGPAKAAVFREEPSTLEEAFAIATREDYIQRLTRGLPAQPSTSDAIAAAQAQSRTALPPAEPMDLSLIDLSNIDLSTVDLAAIDARALHIKCFTCGKFGHFQCDCPRNRGQQTFRGRGRRGNRFSVGRGGRGAASQGNASPQ